MYSGVNGQTETIEMSIGTYETTLNLQLWKAYADEIETTIETTEAELTAEALDELSNNKGED